MTIKFKFNCLTLFSISCEENYQKKVFSKLKYSNLSTKLDQKKRARQKMYMYGDCQRLQALIIKIHRKVRKFHTVRNISWFYLEEHWLDEVSKRLFPIIFLLFNVGFWWHVKNIQTEQLKIPYEKGFKSIIDDDAEKLFYDVNTDDGFVD